MVHEVATLEELQRLKARPQTYTVVDFSAPWCPPCNRIAPDFEELAQSLQRDEVLEFVKVNVDVVEHTGIARLPTFQVFKDDKLVETFSGADQDALSRVIRRTAKSANVLVDSGGTISSSTGK